jgi:hypothetical protein
MLEYAWRKMMQKSATNVKDDDENTGHGACLAEAQTLRDGELYDRLARNHSEGGFIPTEVVVTMFKDARQSGQANRAEKLAGVLTARMTRYAMKWFGSRRKRFPNTELAARELVSDVWQLLIEKPKRAIHAERRFGQFFQRQAIDFMKKASALKRANVATFTDELGDTTSDEDRSPEEILDHSDKDAMGPAKWLEYKQFLEQVDFTEEEHHAFILHFALGLPLESKNPDQPSVSKQMGKTPRMIHNYLKSAKQKLRSAAK